MKEKLGAEREPALVIFLGLFTFGQNLGVNHDRIWKWEKVEDVLMEDQYKGSEDQRGKNHPHVDRLTMDEDYKGHHSQSDISFPTAIVGPPTLSNWTVRSREQFREFDVKRGFATQEDAELGGLIVAKKWIDDGKPALRERGTGSS
jgi:hypothetical protein